MVKLSNYADDKFRLETGIEYLDAIGCYAGIDKVLGFMLTNNIV